MQYRISRVACSTLLTISVVLQARASDSDASDVFGAVTLTSDYVDRGISKSDGHAALQGELGWLGSAGLIAALSAASVDFRDESGATLELNYIIGFQAIRQALKSDIKLVYVDYPGALSAYGYDHLELAWHAQQEIASYELDVDAVVSKDDSAEVSRVLYVSTGVARRIGRYLRIRGHVGKEWAELEGAADSTYMTWGMATEFARERLSLGITYTNTSLDRSCTDPCDGRIAAFIRVTL